MGHLADEMRAPCEPIFFLVSSNRRNHDAHTPGHTCSPRARPTRRSAAATVRRDRGKSEHPPRQSVATMYQGVQHLVTLASVEDDALGEELQVIWELEPGARSSRRSPCPSRPASTRPTGSTPSSTPCAGAPPRTADVREHPGAVPLRHRHRGLPARPGGAGDPDAAGQPARSPTTWASARPSRPAWSSWN